MFAISAGLGEPPSRRLFASISGYVVLVHAITLVAGLAGHLTIMGVGTVLGLALATALFLVRRAERGDDRTIDAASVTAPTLFTGSAAVVTGLLWAWPHLFDATRLWVWDDYTYHMVYPALWLRERTIAAPTTLQAFTMQAWYPLSASVVATWFMLPFQAARGEALAEVSLTGVLYAALVASAMGEGLARLGCRRGTWALPVVLLATSSRVAVMASSFSDADLAQASALFGAFVFAIPRGEDERRRDVAVDAWGAGFLSGLALGVKVSAAPQALIVMLMTALRAAKPGELRRARAAMHAVLAFAIAWAAMAGYWYARNVAHTGNPLYPAAFLGWPGARFPETTLIEYGHRYGPARAAADALAVYASWPFLHAALAVLGLGCLAGGAMLGRRSWSRPRRSFAWGALAIAAATLILLPGAPYSAGNALTFRSGFIHWDSMRYVALLPLLGWTALGFLLDAGAGAPRWRTLLAVLLAAAAVLTPGNALSVPGGVVIALAIGVTVLARLLLPLAMGALGLARRRAQAVALAGVALALVVAASHGAKAAATKTAFYREPLFGAAAAVLDREPPGTRVAVFGDQWIYPAFGDRFHLRPVRVDRDGRLATDPIGDAMEPGELTVDPATFRANLAASRIDVVVLVRQPHPGRPLDLPTQHAALQATGAADLLYQDRAVAIWRLHR